MRPITQLLLAATHPHPEPSRTRALCEGAIDWRAFTSLATRNRIAPLAFNRLDAVGAMERIPATARAALEKHYALTVRTVNSQIATTAEIVARGERVGVPLLVLRGVGVGTAIYGKPYLRPAGDSDLLCRPEQVAPACAILQAMGFHFADTEVGDAAYFERFHLHRHLYAPDRNIHVEIHWALDHPWTLFTPDYDGIWKRARLARWRDFALPVPAAVDQFAALTLHLVKHAVFLPYAPTPPIAAETLIRDRHLLWVADIAHLLAQPGKPPVDITTWLRHAAAWGLRFEGEAIVNLIATLYPDISHGVPVDTRPPSRLKAWAARRYYGRGGPRRRNGWNRLLRWHGTTGFRWVRALDAVTYLFPPTDFLRRRYHAPSLPWLTRYPLHLVNALRRLAAMALAVARMRMRKTDRNGINAR